MRGKASRARRGTPAAALEHAGRRLPPRCPLAATRRGCDHLGVSATTVLRTLELYVGGRFEAPAPGTELLDDRNPATAEPLARVPLSAPDDVDRAVAAARGAQPAWREHSPLARGRAVMRLREELHAHREELAQLVTADMGKTLADARGEVQRGIESTE